MDLQNDKYKNLIWDSTILSTRVTSWILNSEILLSNKDENFKNYFLQSIINQVNHLKKNYKFEDDSLKKIKILLQTYFYRTIKKWNFIIVFSDRY